MNKSSGSTTATAELQENISRDFRLGVFYDVRSLFRQQIYVPETAFAPLMAESWHCIVLITGYFLVKLHQTGANSV